MNKGKMKDSDRKDYIADSARAFAERHIGKREFLRRLGYRRRRALELRSRHAGREPAISGNHVDAGAGRQRRLRQR